MPRYEHSRSGKQIFYFYSGTLTRFDVRNVFIAHNEAKRSTRRSIGLQAKLLLYMGSCFNENNCHLQFRRLCAMKTVKHGKGKTINDAR
jgi:hypothetical protein